VKICLSQVAQDIRTLHDTLCRFKSILVDPAEFACLKAIVLFRSEAKGLKDATQIENLQDQAQVICQRSVNYNPMIMNHTSTL
jgi:nuclear receptor subfamily 2 group E member 3